VLKACPKLFGAPLGAPTARTVEALYGLPIYAGRRTYIRGKAHIYRLEGGEEGHVNIGGTILDLRHG